MKTFAVINHKGGPGKTTTTVNLAGALSQMQYRVLVIDVDAQGDLSAIFLVNHESLQYTTADLFSESGVLLEDVIQPTNYPNIFIIPADNRLNDVDSTHGFETDPRATCLLDAISELAGRFDYVLLDCAGKVHLTGFAAIVAADEVIVPVTPARFAVRNLATVCQECATAQQTFNPNIKIRFFLSQVESRDKSVDTTRQALQNAFGKDRLANSEIPYNRTFKTSINLGKPIGFHSKRSKGSLQTAALARELIGVHTHDPARNAIEAAA